ncbi:MAG: hypothetical protein OQK98_03870 [Gammaproteobacteria bacterium]|nr:hypothetical protein [Gammaproteobacteria bacterium]
MKYINLAMLSLLTITSCSNEAIKDEDSYLYSVPPGSTLTLNQNITIRANLARTFFQNGAVIDESNLNIYYPHCSLTTNTLTDKDRVISPAIFIVQKVIDDEEYAQGYLHFASNNISVSSDGPLITGLVSYYYLSSSIEQDVRTLECIRWDSPYENRHLSIREIRKSLGDILTLTIAE